jgi:hypothetical protein
MTAKEEMASNKKTARIVGVLFPDYVIGAEPGYGA